jgi:chromosome segregation ATPase
LPDAEIRSASGDFAVLETERQELEEEWHSIWPAMVKRGNPAEMQEWCDARKAIVEHAHAVRSLQQNVTLAEAQDQQWREQLGQALNLPASLPLSELVARAQSEVQHADAVHSRRAELNDAIRTHADQLSSAERELAHLQCNWQTWVKNWTEATARLPVQQMADPELAQRLLDAIRDAKECDRAIADLDHRIGRMQENQSEFRSRLQVRDHIDTHIQSSNNSPCDFTGRGRSLMRPVVEFVRRDRIQYVSCEFVLNFETGLVEL